jgi:hypothetical protein
LMSSAVTHGGRLPRKTVELMCIAGRRSVGD